MKSCATCGAWLYGSDNNKSYFGIKHKCPPKFYVVPKNEYDPNVPFFDLDYYEVRAHDGEDAAELFVEKYDDGSGEAPTEFMRVVTFNPSTGETQTFEVRSCFNVSYHAEESK